jgi:hypothetical protein
VRAMDSILLIAGSYSNDAVAGAVGPGHEDTFSSWLELQSGGQGLGL